MVHGFSWQRREPSAHTPLGQAWTNPGSPGAGRRGHGDVFGVAQKTLCSGRFSGGQYLRDFVELSLYSQSSDLLTCVVEKIHVSSKLMLWESRAMR